MAPEFRSRTRRPRATTALAAVCAIILSSCSEGNDSHTAPTAPPDPSPIRVTNSGPATVFDLGGGARLTIPPCAITDGATVSATYREAPTAGWGDRIPLAAPVELRTDPPDSIHGILTLEFPANGNTGDTGDHSLGVTTFDVATNSWESFPSTYDPVRHVVTAKIPHFSWWNPYSWDWAGIFARANQDIGQLVGRRAGEASCSSSAPDWVASTAGITNDAAIAIRSCTQSQGDILDVQLVNNRPYGMVLSYGSAVKWGWHEPGGNAKDIAANKVADGLIGSNQLYLPPLSRASVGILKPTPGQNYQFTAGITGATVLIDALKNAVNELLSRRLPSNVAVSCGTYLTGFVGSNSPSAIRSNLIGAGGCMKNLWLQDVAAGRLDKVPVEKLGSILDGLKTAQIVGRYYRYYGIEWQLADLFADNVVVDNSSLGAGFSVLAKAAPVQQPPVQQPPVQQPPVQQPPVQQPPVQQPPVQQPPVQQPPVQQPPVQQPPVQQPPVQQPPVQQPPVQPVANHSETVGGQTHTWTNYTNAGGDEGPVINSGTTVQIACKLHGFHVSNGNDWWYKVASDPWSSRYYASADAFYNNGRTSGSLVGTPYQDDAVTLC